MIVFEISVFARLLATTRRVCSSSDAVMRTHCRPIDRAPRKVGNLFFKLVIEIVLDDFVRAIIVIGQFYRIGVYRYVAYHSRMPRL